MGTDARETGVQRRHTVFDEIGPHLGRRPPEARLPGFVPLRTSIALGVAASRRVSRPPPPGLASERRAALAAVLQQELRRRLGGDDGPWTAALRLQSWIDAESCLDAPAPD